MRRISTLVVPIGLALFSAFANAQPFDAQALAKGWSRADITGACAFNDAPSQRIYLWTWDHTLDGSVPYQRIEQTPEFWFFDSRNNAWIVAGSTLFNVDKNGKVVESVRLPAEVSDLIWDANHLYVVYRASSLYVEKRDQRTGALVWAQGTKPAGPVRMPKLSRLALSEDGKQLYIATGESLDLNALDASSGKILETVRCAPQAPVPASLQLEGRDRLPLHALPNRGMLLSCVSSADVKEAGGPWLHLLVFDLAGRKVSLLRTSLTPDHLFIGVVENKAHFTRPKGGLVAVEVP